MCFWIKVDESWIAGDPISLYYRQKDSQIISFLYLHSGEVHFVFQVTPEINQGRGEQE